MRHAMNVETVHERVKCSVKHFNCSGFAFSGLSAVALSVVDLVFPAGSRQGGRSSKENGTHHENCLIVLFSGMEMLFAQ